MDNNNKYNSNELMINNESNNVTVLTNTKKTIQKTGRVLSLSSKLNESICKFGIINESWVNEVYDWFVSNDGVCGMPFRGGYGVNGEGFSKERYLSFSNIYIEGLKGLLSMPSTVNRLQFLEEISIQGKDIYELPEEVTLLTNVKKISIIDTNITQLPENIGNLVNLEELDLEFNQLKDLPGSIQNLKKLKSLNIRNNSFTQFPDIICELDSLVELKIGKEIDEYEEGESEILINTAPNNLSKLKNLERLLIQKGSFETLDPDICKISSLKYLSIYSSNLKELPMNIGELTNLETLTVMYCEVQNLPLSITQCKKLKDLCLLGNNLTSLPSWICDLNLEKYVFENRT